MRSVITADDSWANVNPFARECDIGEGQVPTIQ
jgi:hypothetical protein